MKNGSDQSSFKVTQILEKNAQPIADFLEEYMKNILSVKEKYDNEEDDEEILSVY